MNSDNGAHVPPQASGSPKTPQSPPNCPESAKSDHNSDHVTSPSTSIDRASDDTNRAKTTSQRKIEANRQNAKRSTGPKTARGKKIVSRNAIKHGLLAKQVVISAGDGEEDRPEFEKLAAGIWDYYDPVGKMEELLVESIATYYWRLGRVVRSETGELEKTLNSVHRDTRLERIARESLATGEIHLLFRALQSRDLARERQSKWLQDHNQELVPDAKGEISPKAFDAPSRQRMEWVVSQQNELKRHYVGATYICKLLEQAKEELAETGNISMDLLTLIDAAMGGTDNSLVFALSMYVKDEENAEQPESGDDSSHTERGKLIQMIDRQLQMIEVYKQYALRDRSLEPETEARSRSLPLAEVCEKILRYEAHIERQLSRKMAQLERLQRRRLGDDVPPPMSFNFGVQ